MKCGMTSGVQQALAGLHATVHRAGEAPAVAQSDEIASRVRQAAAAGASIDEIAVAGDLSISWVISILEIADAPVRDRLGKPIWLLWP